MSSFRNRNFNNNGGRENDNNYRNRDCGGRSREGVNINRVSCGSKTNSSESGGNNFSRDSHSNYENRFNSFSNENYVGKSVKEVNLLLNPSWEDDEADINPTTTTTIEPKNTTSSFNQSTSKQYELSASINNSNNQSSYTLNEATNWGKNKIVPPSAALINNSEALNNMNWNNSIVGLNSTSDKSLLQNTTENINENSFGKKYGGPTNVVTNQPQEDKSFETQSNNLNWTKNKSTDVPLLILKDEKTVNENIVDDSVIKQNSDNEFLERSRPTPRIRNVERTLSQLSSESNNASLFNKKNFLPSNNGFNYDDDLTKSNAVYLPDIGLEKKTVPEPVIIQDLHQNNHNFHEKKIPVPSVNTVLQANMERESLKENVFSKTILQSNGWQGISKSDICEIAAVSQKIFEAYAEMNALFQRFTQRLA